METRLLLTKEQHDQLDDVFSYHAPSGTQVEQYRVLRTRARWFAETIMALCPDSADRTDALRKVREALMTANAAIALNGRGLV